MAWNWRQPNWPQFAWVRAKLARADFMFAEGAGVAIGAAKHLIASERGPLTARRPPGRR
jgi:hypothetical protein